ncbi:DUF2787 family protein [Vibrio navarrensis]|nr:DUF2787 family protein [Vibrio navarrensis]
MLNHKQNLPFSVTSKLSEFLAQRINKDGLSVINFRNSKYHPETGGFRPVEIMIEKIGRKLRDNLLHRVPLLRTRHLRRTWEVE